MKLRFVQLNIVCLRKQSILESPICTDSRKTDFWEGKNVSEAVSGKCHYQDYLLLP